MSRKRFGKVACSRVPRAGSLPATLQNAFQDIRSWGLKPCRKETFALIGVKLNHQTPKPKKPSYSLSNKECWKGLVACFVLSVHYSLTLYQAINYISFSSNDDSICGTTCMVKLVNAYKSLPACSVWHFFVLCLRIIPWLCWNSQQHFLTALYFRFVLFNFSQTFLPGYYT